MDLKRLEKEMPRIGLEPTCPKALDPKSSVSTNFTTWAEHLCQRHETDPFILYS
uniref:Uncharacterized protein n=1 Tax=Chlamydia pneumoniae TaxID=83558 RepID=A0A0F7X0Z9_CHLPN|nr:hypothetical protein BN1224_H12_FM_00180 [Chlamydia pneumoniae]CRI54288.1 hypothetical protein BN1224_Wien2_I_00620 [Chlamydia pneumoniae]